LRREGDRSRKYPCRYGHRARGSNILLIMKTSRTVLCVVRDEQRQQYEQEFARLGKLGAELVFESESEQALALIRELDPHLLIVGMDLGFTEGIEFLAMVTAEFPDFEKAFVMLPDKGEGLSPVIHTRDKSTGKSSVDEVEFGEIEKLVSAASTTRKAFAKTLVFSGGAPPPPPPPAGKAAAAPEAKKTQLGMPAAPEPPAAAAGPPPIPPQPKAEEPFAPAEEPEAPQTAAFQDTVLAQPAGEISAPREPEPEPEIELPAPSFPPAKQRPGWAIPAVVSAGVVVLAAVGFLVFSGSEEGQPASEAEAGGQVAAEAAGPAEKAPAVAATAQPEVEEPQPTPEAEEPGKAKPEKAEEQPVAKAEPELERPEKRAEPEEPAGQTYETPTGKQKILPLAFEKGRSTPSITNGKLWSEMVNDFEQQGGMLIVLRGHTTPLADERVSWELGLLRARRVMELLVERGIPRNRIKLKSAGDREPITSNDTQQGRNRNRRVTVSLQPM
jgi:outer membrane protein OmpA-like peptidoglycan-associated protein